jgi:hypothetical protein
MAPTMRDSGPIGGDSRHQWHHRCLWEAWASVTWRFGAARKSACHGLIPKLTASPACHPPGPIRAQFRALAPGMHDSRLLPAPALALAAALRTGWLWQPAAWDRMVATTIRRARLPSRPVYGEMFGSGPPAALSLSADLRFNSPVVRPRANHPEGRGVRRAGSAAVWSRGGYLGAVERAAGYFGYSAGRMPAEGDRCQQLTTTG